MTNCKTESNTCYDVNSIINIGNLRNCGANDIATGRKAVKLLEEHGWLMVDIADNNQSNQSEQMNLIRAWRTTLGAAFDQPDNIKDNFEKFHLENGISVGYKSDDTREFFETRLLESSCSDTKDMRTVNVKSDALAGLLGGFGKSDDGVIVHPDCPSVMNYSKTVKALFTVLSELGSIILSILAESMGLDPSCLLDLTDLKSPEHYQLNLLSKQMYKSDHNTHTHTHTNTQDNIIKHEIDGKQKEGSGTQKNVPSQGQGGPKKGLDGEILGDYSSSLLRVCRYGIDSNQFLLRDQDREIAFGAHTDTSFISIGLCSSEPGLEILDKKSYEWVCPENFVMAPADKNGDITAFNPSSDIDKDKVRNIGGAGGRGGGGIFGLGLKDDNDDGEGEEEEEEVLRVPVSPTIAVVFLGEFLQVLTGGKFSATPHRVRCLPTTSPSNSSASSPAGKGSSVRGLHSPFTVTSSTHNSPETDNNNTYNSISNSNNNSNNNINNNDNTAHGCSYYNILDTATSKCTEKSPPHVLNIPAPQKAQNFLPDILQTPPSKNVLPIKNIFPTKNIPPTPTSITSISSINSSDQISPHPKLKNVIQRSPLSVIQSVLKKVPFGLKFSKAAIEDKKKMTSSKKGNVLLNNEKGLSRYESNNDTEDSSILLSTRKESFRSEYDVAVRTHCDAPVSVPLPATVTASATENSTAYVIEKRIRAMSDVSVNSNPSLMTKHNREPLKNNPVFRSRRKPTYKIDSDVTAFSVDMNDITPLPLPQYCDARKYKMVPTSYRVSCPFIIRGKHTAVINIRNRNYLHKNWGALGLNFKANTSEKEDKENINRNTAENKNTSPTSTSTTTSNNNNSPDSERESIYTPGQTKKWIMPDLDGTSMLLIHKLLDMKRKRCANMHESSDSDWVLSAFPVQPPAIPESDDCDESRLL